MQISMTPLPHLSTKVREKYVCTFLKYQIDHTIKILTISQDECSWYENGKIPIKTKFDYFVSTRQNWSSRKTYLSPTEDIADCIPGGVTSMSPATTPFFRVSKAVVANGWSMSSTIFCLANSNFLSTSRGFSWKQINLLCCLNLIWNLS